jgi:Protein of unknown function (DUF1552)
MIVHTPTTRRRFLKGLGGAALALPFYEMLKPRAARAGGVARRAIFFYFPDGVAIPNDDPSQSWHPTGGERGFTLSRQLEPLAPYKDDCVFLRGVSLGPDGSNNHAAGAKKLLTGVTEGNGQSLDQFLAQTAGNQAPWRHLYLGAMSKTNASSPRSSDSYISYPSAGNSIVPEDNPAVAFQSLFGSATGVGSGGPQQDPLKVSVIDGVLDDMNRLKAQLGGVEAQKLDMHLDSLREVERRIKGTGAPVPTASCESPTLAAPGSEDLYSDVKFPAIMKAQIDLMVLAMACGLTKVGTLQASYHTSELNMGLFPESETSVGNGMRSHQASHYGDTSNQLYSHFVLQRRWFVSQFAYLLEQLKSRPEDGGTMLDNSIILLCTEVSDGNTHSHDNMPFVLAGRAGGALSTGRLLDYNYTRHSNLLSSIAHAMGQPTCFGHDCSGPLPGLLS